MLTKLLNCSEDVSASELLSILRNFEKIPRHGKYFTSEQLEMIGQELKEQKPSHPAYHIQWFECYRLGIVWGAAQLKHAEAEFMNYDDKLAKLVMTYPAYWKPIREKITNSFIVGQKYGKLLLKINDEERFADGLYQLLKVQTELLNAGEGI